MSNIAEIQLQIAPGYTVAIIIFLLCLVIGEGIIIYYLSKNNSNNIYGSGETAKKITVFKLFWGPFVVYVVATSIITLFIASFIADKNISLNDMNTWVSLILGMVALIIGVISLFLSFYNVEQAYQSQTDNLNEMKKVQEDLSNKISNMDIRMQKGFYNITTYGRSEKNGNVKFTNKPYKEQYYGE